MDWHSGPSATRKGVGVPEVQNKGRVLQPVVHALSSELLGRPRESE